MENRGAIVCLAVALAAVVPSARSDAQGPPEVPTYTNDDLERVSPYRGETGVLSRPADRGSAGPSAEPKEKGEAYWRREAERLRERLRPLKRRAEELRRRIEEARSEPSGKRSRAGAAKAQGESLARRLEGIEAEIRERENELYERARRERALPGWLR